MNKEKARAAFEKWCVENSPDDWIEIWTGGAEWAWGECEVMFTVDEHQVESVIKDWKKLQAENQEKDLLVKLLKDTIEKQSIEIQGYSYQYKSVVDLCLMNEKLEKLQAELSQVKKANESLSEQNKKLRECVEFYSYSFQRTSDYVLSDADKDHGKRARQCLKEIEEKE